jgi:sugar lactone lactonase YvrE
MLRLTVHAVVVVTHLLHRSGTNSAIIAAALLLTAASATTQASPGDIYVSNGSSGTILKITPAGAQSNFATGINGPWGLAFDRAGNLFVAEELNQDILRIMPDGTVSVFASGVGFPVGLAFDNAGNLFVSSQNSGGSGDIIKFTPGGTRSTFASSVAAPYKLAFDGSGNLFVGTNSLLGIIEFAPDGTQSSFASGRGYIGLAFDATGSLFASSGDSGGGEIFSFTPSGTRSTFASGLPGGLEGLSFDNAGNLFAVGYYGQILKFAPDGTQTSFAPTSQANDVAVEPTTAQAVSFQAPVFYGGFGGPDSVAVGDFNRDGKPDLVVVEESGSHPGVSTLLGNGDGTLQPPVFHELGSEPSAVAVGDLNGDNKLDLVVTNFYYGAGCQRSDLSACIFVSSLLGNGDGTFQPPVNTVLNAPGCPSPDRCGGGLSIVMRDFNGDGKLDIVVADPFSSGPTDYLQVLLGNGDGTFQPEVDYYLPQGSVHGVTAGDFNGDGKVDLVFGFNGSTQAVGFMAGNGDGTFQPPTFFQLPSNANPQSIAVGDFNRDGKMDLAVANFNDLCPSNGCYASSVFIGNGDGTFQPAVNYTVDANPQSIVVDDFNGDGKPDLVVADSFGGDVSVLIGNGDGTFQAAVNFTAGARPVSIAVGDFNMDQRPDLAVANIVDGTVSVLLNASTVTPTNHSPVASCHNVTVSAGAACTANASIDNGSFDPDSGDTITVIQSPSGPYPLGTTTVTLTVTDNHGASSSCTATVSVVDTTPPAISCPSSISVDASDASGARVSYPLPAASDSCSAVSVICSQPSGGTFAIGATSVGCTATDASNNAASCSFTVTVTSPRDTARDVLNQMLSLRATVTNKRDGKKLDNAIKQLTDSLDPNLWIDSTHPTPKDGDKVFNKQEVAVITLADLILHQHGDISNATLQTFIDRIAKLDRVLALTAISDGVSRGADPRKIAKANNEIASGDGSAASQPDSAIDHYGKAWDLALKA